MALAPSKLNRLEFERAAEIIRQAAALIVAAGAGIGVDSGLPDFHGKYGFWRIYPALAARGLRFEHVAQPETFVSDPRVAWGFYGHRLQLYRRTVPHAGFGALLRWAKNMRHGYFVFTSNVDGQFQVAGFDPARVWECHGSIHRLQCLDDCMSTTWSAKSFEPLIDGAACRLVGELPRCPYCDGVARPNVLMFGDWKWNGAAERAQDLAFQKWSEKVTGCIAVVEIGAGNAIPSVQQFSADIHDRHGAAIVRINPTESGLEGGKGVALARGGLEALTRIDAVMSRSYRRRLALASKPTGTIHTVQNNAPDARGTRRGPGTCIRQGGGLPVTAVPVSTVSNSYATHGRVIAASIVASPSNHWGRCGCRTRSLYVLGRQRRQEEQ